MKHKNYYRAVALLLAVMMVLGLAACGGAGGSNSQNNGSGPISQSQNDDGSIQNNQPSTTKPAHEQTELAQTDTSVESEIWTLVPGYEDGNQYALVFYNDFARLYEFRERYGYFYLKDMYSCSWTQNDDIIYLSAYDDDGTLVYSCNYFMEYPILRYPEGDDLAYEWWAVSPNNGTKGSLVGKWYDLSCMNTIQFYSDGTYSAAFGRNEGSGEYTYTSKFNQPAVALYNDSRNTSVTYRYEFLENDLIMIYFSDDESTGFVFTRCP